MLRRSVAAAVLILFCVLFALRPFVTRPHAPSVAVPVGDVNAARAALSRWATTAARVAPGPLRQPPPETLPRASIESGESSLVVHGNPRSAAAAAAGSSTTPVHAILMAAPGLKYSDLVMALASLSHSAPDTVLLLLVTAAQAASLAERVSAPTADASLGLSLWLRLYDWDALTNRLPKEEAAYFPAIRRYAMFPLMLDDLERAGAPPNDAAVLFSNLDAAHLRAPHAVLLADARDIVFQGDPFSSFWEFVAPPLPADGPKFDPSWADAPTIVVAGEARVALLGEDDWNRAWVSFCYYDLGEAMVNAVQIYCSGTTFGTLAGIRLYLTEGMLPAMRQCAEIGYHKGMDQGIHNVLTHTYSHDDLEAWRFKADGGGPFRPGGGKTPIMSRPRDFLDFIEAFQARLRVLVAHAEDGWICTMALLLRKGVHLDAATGDVLPAPGAPPCTIVHQFDRVDSLFAAYQRRYNTAITNPTRLP